MALTYTTVTNDCNKNQSSTQLSVPQSVPKK